MLAHRSTIHRCGTAIALLHGEGETIVMKRNLLKKRVMGVVLGLSLLVGIGIASSQSVAQAQWRDRDYQREQLRRQREWEREQRRRQRQADRWDDRYDRGGSFDMRQTALNAGYNEGIKEGRKDRNNRDRFDYRDEEDFRNANTDYQSRFGNRQLYAQYFRQGFVNGYTDGYRGY
jgi:hypothetical protein